MLTLDIGYVVMIISTGGPRLTFLRTFGVNLPVPVAVNPFLWMCICIGGMGKVFSHHFRPTNQGRMGAAVGGFRNLLGSARAGEHAELIETGQLIGFNNGGDGQTLRRGVGDETNQ